MNRKPLLLIHHFRERALAASLKQDDLHRLSQSLWHFRERALAASLKRAG